MNAADLDTLAREHPAVREAMMVANAAARRHSQALTDVERTAADYQVAHERVLALLRRVCGETSEVTA